MISSNYSLANSEMAAATEKPRSRPWKPPARSVRRAADKSSHRKRGHRANSLNRIEKLQRRGRSV